MAQNTKPTKKKVVFLKKIKILYCFKMQISWFAMQELEWDRQ